MGQLATFRIGHEIFGVDLLLAKEISKIHDITEVPESPDFVFGLMNLRGQIVTVIKPSVLMETAVSELSNDSRLLILKTRGQTDILIKRGLLSSNHLGCYRVR
jgi:purine-binding chemotaxis protein CheW